jgi:MFS family permease
MSDITTVRERGKYMAIVFAAVGLGLALGPPLGGVMAEHDWRWAFVRISKNLIQSTQRAGTLWTAALQIWDNHSRSGNWDTWLTINEISGSIFLSAAFP